jgi:hypothetical protein
MIYLICQPSFKNDHISLKIGYASSLEARYKQYEACTPSFKKISSRPGNRDEEALIHRYFHGLNDINFIKSEWYEIHKDKLDWFIDEFQKDYSDMEKAILGDFTNISVPLYKYFSKRHPTDPRVAGFNKKSMGLNKKINLLYRRKIQEHQELKDSMINFLKNMGDTPDPTDRLKLLCETKFESDTYTMIAVNLTIGDNLVYESYINLGPIRCKELGYDVKKIKWEITHGNKSIKVDVITNEIYKEFQVGNKISKSETKQRLKEIYSRLGYDKAPKATDIKDYFDIRRVVISDPVTKKRLEAYELLRKLL